MFSLASALLAPACGRSPAMSDRYSVKHDLIAMLGEATVSMPALESVQGIAFETGDWDFDSEGYVHLTRTGAFYNRLTFEPDVREAPGGALSFRYRTRWAEAGEQLLTVFFGERPGTRYAILFRSDGAVTVERQRLGENLPPATTSVLAQVRGEPTNEVWRTYRVEVRERRVLVAVDEKTAVDASLLEDEDDGYTSTDGAWGVELSRSGAGNHRAQAVLGGLLHQRLSNEGDPVASARLAPDRKPARAEVQLLNLEYSPDRLYQSRDFFYLVKTAERRMSEHGRELVPGLFAPAGSVYAYRLSAEPGERLQARYGFDLGRTEEGSDAVTFFAELTSGGRSQRLFEKTVSAEAQKQQGDFFSLDVELPVRRESTVELRLGVSRPAGGDPQSESSAVRPGLTFWGAPLVLSRDSEEAARPNVILISVDTLRPDFIGPFNEDSAGHTPNLSAFGRSAVRFTEAFTVSPWTLPAHFSLLTGRYPSRHGLNLAYGHNGTLADGAVTTMAEVLGRNGYLTAAIASDHSLNPDYGVDKGFHSFVDESVRDAAPLIPTFKAFIEKHRRQSFFLFLHSYDVHAPLFREANGEGRPGSPEKISYDTFLHREPTEIERDNVRRLYQNHAGYYDARFGELISILKQNGLFERSLIVVTADHGEELFERGSYLHGHSLYDELLRVPLLVKFPAESAFPGTNESLTALIDVVPSLLDYLDVPIPPELDGASFMPVLAGRAREQRRYFFAEALAWGPEAKALRTREYKYILTRPGVPDYEPRNPLYDSILETGGSEKLYRITDDRGEERDVLDGHRDLAESFRKALEPLWTLERREGAPVELDPKELENLRSLGYVRD